MMNSTPIIILYNYICRTGIIIYTFMMLETRALLCLVILYFVCQAKYKFLIVYSSVLIN